MAQTEQRTCAYCKQPFTTRVCSDQRNCSTSCGVRGRADIREPKSQEMKARLSASRRGMKFSLEHRQALSAAKIKAMERGAFGGKQREFVGKNGERTWAHSSYEFKRMEFLDNCVGVVKWTKRHGLAIPYMWQGAVHRYIPDFLVTYVDGRQSLQEVKGWIRDPERFEFKKRAAQEYCRAHGMEYRVLFHESLEEE